VYASYIDEPVLRFKPSGSESLYYHRNQQYSVVALTNASAAIVERYAYSAYGVPTITNAAGTILPVGSVNNRYMYTGREWDSVIAQYHYRARMYDANLGRFASRDPIGYEGRQLSLFSYVGNQVLCTIDPFGLEGVWPNQYYVPPPSQPEPPVDPEIMLCVLVVVADVITVPSGECTPAVLRLVYRTRTVCSLAPSPSRPTVTVPGVPGTSTPSPGPTRPTKPTPTTPKPTSLPGGGMPPGTPPISVPTHTWPTCPEGQCLCCDLATGQEPPGSGKIKNATCKCGDPAVCWAEYPFAACIDPDRTKPDGEPIEDPKHPKSSYNWSHH
jgi:RHS repeat-associated protein